MSEERDNVRPTTKRKERTRKQGVRKQGAHKMREQGEGARGREHTKKEEEDAQGGGWEAKERNPCRDRKRAQETFSRIISKNRNLTKSRNFT